MNEKILESFIEILPFLKILMQEDMDAIVTDTTKVLAYVPGERTRVPVVVGQELNPKQPTYQAIHQKKIVSKVVPEEVYGIIFKSVVYPLTNSSGEIIGTVGIGRSMEKQSKIEESAKNLFASLKQTNLAVEEIAVGSQNLSQSIATIINLTKIADDKLRETDSILKLVKSISSQTNLLGLNAAIEAARAGESGRGFSIVASEIRELSKQASGSAQEISNELSNIKNAVTDIIEDIQGIGDITAGQASATEEATATLQEITSTFETLVKATKVI